MQLHETGSSGYLMMSVNHGGIRTTKTIIVLCIGVQVISVHFKRWRYLCYIQPCIFALKLFLYRIESSEQKVK